MFSAGCTMNIGWKKLLREITWRFWGVQRSNLGTLEINDQPFERTTRVAGDAMLAHCSLLAECLNWIDRSGPNCRKQARCERDG